MILMALVFPMKIKFREHTVMLVLLFVVYMAIHVPFARNNYWAYKVTVMSLENVVGLLGFAFLMRNISEYNKMLNVWILSMFILALIGIANKGGVPGSSYMGDENDFALAMNIILPFGYFAMLREESKLKKIMLLTVTMVYLLANISSFSRGGFVGLIPVVVYCWLRTRKKIKYTLILGIVLLGTMITFTPAEYWEEMETISEYQQESTAELRMYYWKCGWRMFKDNILFGVGPGNFPWNIYYYEDKEGKHGRYHGGRPAHSIYLTLLPELGLMGTIIFCWIMIEVLKNRRWMLSKVHEYHKRGTEKGQDAHIEGVPYVIYALDAGMIAYFITGTFLSVLYYPWLWTLIGISLGLKNIIREWIEKQQVVLAT